MENVSKEMFEYINKQLDKIEKEKNIKIKVYIIRLLSLKIYTLFLYINTLFIVNTINVISIHTPNNKNMPSTILLFFIIALNPLIVNRNTIITSDIRYT